ncbi:MAG: hypothetical protein CVV32_02120 [Methanomicrobiales archaeon HGW-Methanomicrobiales-3]|jgi:hypothetical protein|nr:MAG: hypothetical protein CVV32_02120 [Methanomicrobiales archaeon HGW-Methanomicrobiales-3]
MTRLSDIVSCWLGLCPNRPASRARNRISSLETPPLKPLEKNVYSVKGILAEYSNTEPVRGFVIALVAAAVGILVFGIFFLLAFPLRYYAVLFTPLLLIGMMVMVIQGYKRASLEISSDTVTIRRFFHAPVVIRRDTIETVTIQPTMLPVPLRHLKIMYLILMPVLSAILLILEYHDMIAGTSDPGRFLADLVFYPCICLFFIAFYNHNSLKSTFPETLVITTTEKKTARIYNDDPSGIAGILRPSP